MISVLAEAPTETALLGFYNPSDWRFPQTSIRDGSLANGLFGLTQ